MYNLLELHVYLLIVWSYINQERIAWHTLRLDPLLRVLPYGTQVYTGQLLGLFSKTKTIVDEIMSPELINIISFTVNELVENFQNVGRVQKMMQLSETVRTHKDKISWNFFYRSSTSSDRTGALECSILLQRSCICNGTCIRPLYIIYGTYICPIYSIYGICSAVIGNCADDRNKIKLLFAELESSYWSNLWYMVTMEVLLIMEQ